MKIEFIPVIPDNRVWAKNIVEHLTLQEVFEKYGHLLSDKEKLNLVREIQKSWIKDEDYLKRMTEETEIFLKDSQSIPNVRGNPKVAAIESNKMIREYVFGIDPYIYIRW